MTVSANESLGRREMRASCFRFQRAAMLLVTIAAGCREAPTTVSGSVTLDGKPLAVCDGRRGTVVFQPDHDGPVLNGIIGPEGTYRMANGSSNRVQPGNYIVTVSAVEITPPTDENPQPSSKRLTPGRFASAADSGLRVEVQPGPNDIDLSLTSDAGAEDNCAKSSGATDQTMPERSSAQLEDVTP